MTTLLEKAKQITHGRKTSVYYSDEELELAIAYFKGEITHTQTSQALGKSTGATSARMHTVLKDAVRRGKVKILKTK